MPFVPPRLNMARCMFTGYECKKNCPAALAHPEDETTWCCKWIETLDLMAKCMHAIMVRESLVMSPLETPVEPVAGKKRFAGGDTP